MVIVCCSLFLSLPLESILNLVVVIKFKCAIKLIAHVPTFQERINAQKTGRQ
jgi:hypothetical protein